MLRNFLSIRTLRPLHSRRKSSGPGFELRDTLPRSTALPSPTDGMRTMPASVFFLLPCSRSVSAPRPFHAPLRFARPDFSVQPAPALIFAPHARLSFPDPFLSFLSLCRVFHSPTHAPSPHTSAYGYSPADCAARSRPGLSLPTRSDLRPNRVKPDGTQLFHGSAAPAVGLLRVSVRKARHKTHKNRYYKFLMQISTAFSALKINATRIAPHSRPQPSFRAAPTPAAGRPRRDSRTLDRND